MGKTTCSNLVIGDYELIENTSTVYRNGTVWKTRSSGNCTIVGLLEKHLNYHVFLVRFDDGTLIKARNTNIKNGLVRNPYYCNICNGIACLGNATCNHFMYAHWKQMIERCHNEHYIRYDDYGGRGIKVCKRWLCFEYFLNDIEKYENYELLKNGRYYQIDRTDNNKDYCFENCKIVSAKENSRNKRNNIFIKVFKNGVKVEIGYLIDISDKYNLARSTIKRRVKNQSIINGIEFQFATREEYENESIN